MKRGLYVFLFCLSVMLFSFGCSKDFEQIVFENISEEVETYFCGVGDFKAKLSSGQREEPYTYNGKRSALVDFAVLSVFCDCDKSMISVDVVINGQIETKILELNTINGEFVVDLEKKINESDVVLLKYGGSELTLECKSKDFQINSQKALDIGIGIFKEDLNKLVSKNELLAEVYLRVLDNAKDNFNRAYWYFYIYAVNNQTYSCVIDVMTGDIVLKN